LSILATTPSGERITITQSDIFKPSSWRAWLDTRRFVAVDGCYDDQNQIRERNLCGGEGSSHLGRRRCGCVEQRRSRMDVEPTAYYEILMPETIIRYGIFAAFGARKAAQ
jgi:hypothetical protein